MPIVLFSPFEDDSRCAKLAENIGAKVGEIELRQFPDGETYLRYHNQLRECSVVIVCTLDHPDSKVLPLIFAAQTARELGADKVGLVAPYLAYMRQDCRFKSGEAVTSRSFAKLISDNFDWLVTIDPHLHRYKSLTEIYSIPTEVIHAAPILSGWIANEVEKPLIVGPDSESKQWVAAVAKTIGCPFIVLEKVRHGDRDVEVSFPEVENHPGLTPVLLDDIISTGRTMIEACHQLGNYGMSAPVCIGLHGIFTDNAYEDLIAAGASRVVTTNTISHVSNAIDMTDLLAQAVQNMIAQQGTP